MGQYAGGRRRLPYPLHNSDTLHRTTEDDDCTSSSVFSWPSDPDERVILPFSLSLNEYNVLGNAIDVGSDIAYSIDAVRVMWLWLRNMRCAVETNMFNVRQSSADCKVLEKFSNGSWVTFADFNGCIVDGATGIQGIQGIPGGIGPIGPIGPAGGNPYPPLPTEEIQKCNAAAFIIGKVRSLIQGIVTDLATLTPREILEQLLNGTGWKSNILLQLIGALQAPGSDQILIEFDAASELLKCELFLFDLDKDVFTDWVADQTNFSQALRTAIEGAVNAAAAEGRYALWATLGAINTDADCVACEPPVIVPIFRVLTAGGAPGGTSSVTDNGNGTFGVIFTASVGGDGIGRAVMTDDNLNCWRILAVSYSATPTGTSSHYVCGANPSGNDYEPGATEGALLVGSCYGGIVASRFEGAFTVTVTIEAC